MNTQSKKPKMEKHIVEKYADKLKNERIKDLEDEVSRLREALRYR